MKWTERYSVYFSPKMPKRQLLLISWKLGKINYVFCAYEFKLKHSSQVDK